MTPDRSEDPAPPPLGAYLERRPLRLFVEGVVGAAGGGILAHALPDQADRLALFVTVGALAAPIALLLTPVRGSLRYRAVRYGLSLAVLVTLVASFVAGADGLLVDELLGLGVFVFAVGTLGHAVLSIALGGGEGEDEPTSRGPGDQA